MKDETEQIEYPLPDLTSPEKDPSYSAVLEWMKGTKGRRVTFDFWARGNYMRRLLLNRARNVEPVLVRVDDPRQMAWAYKRLALLGIPVEFIYAGKCKKAKVFHLCPWDITIDAGWGYISALGSKTRIADRDYFPIIGNAKLMPEEILDWVVEEAADEFLAGQVFVSPAELIGIDPKATPVGLAQHSELSGGTPVTEAHTAQAIMELSIPFIDKLRLADYRKLLRDHADHLQPFRKTFADYVATRGQSEEKAKESLRHLCAEVQELTKSDTHVRFRDVVGALGGILGLTSAIVGAASGEMTAVMAASGAVMSSAKSAFAVHEQLRQKSRETEKKVRASPHALFWKLGMTRPEAFAPARQIQLGAAPRQTTSEFNANAAYHWLCPPSPGLQHLAVKTT